jgi:hypothetical protein
MNIVFICGSHSPCLFPEYKHLFHMWGISQWYMPRIWNACSYAGHITMECAPHMKRVYICGVFFSLKRALKQDQEHPNWNWMSYGRFNILNFISVITHSVFDQLGYSWNHFKALFKLQPPRIFTVDYASHMHVFFIWRPCYSGLCPHICTLF